MTKRKVKVDNLKKREEHKAYGKSLEVARLKMMFVKEHFNANYYTARCNMMAEQIGSDNIVEKIDDCLKTKDLMIHEYALMKMQAINAKRNAFFQKEDLVKKHGVIERELLDLIKDYVSGPISRESYDEEFKPDKNKAEFVKSDK